MRMLAPVEMRRPMAASDNNQSLSDVRQLHPHWLRRIGRSGLLVVILALLLLIGGFLWFLWRVPAAESEVNGDADASQSSRR